MKLGPQSAPESSSIRGLAKRLGVDDRAVRKAIARGRLTEACVGKDSKGKPVITDVAVAVEEWARNAAKVPKKAVATSLSEAQRRLALERTRSMKLATDQKLGRVIPADKAYRDNFESARLIRDAVLNVPVRIAAELAAETDAGLVLHRLTEELKKALESAASRLLSA